jgi:hypothetical protein
MNAAIQRLAPITMLLCAALAAAEPFNPALVSADARWVAHIDFDRARESEGLSRLLKGHLAPDEDDLQRLQRRLGVQIAGLDGDDFSFICAYGAGDGHSEIAIIGAAPGAVDWFLSWMSATGEAQPDEQAGPWLVRSWRRHGRLTAMARVELPAAAGAEALRGAMVIADSVEEVVAGAQVAAGQAPSLADAGDAALKARPAAGSILFLAADGIDEFQGLRPRAVALREATRLKLDFGESRGAEPRMYLEATVSTTGPEQAIATRDVFSGLRGWGRMAIAQSDRARQCAPLLDAFKLSVDGADVVISWSAEVDALPQPPPVADQDAPPPPAPPAP